MGTNLYVHLEGMSIDELLDYYNNYKITYENTGMKQFKNMMDFIMGYLHEMSKGKLKQEVWVSLNKPIVLSYKLKNNNI